MATMTYRIIHQETFILSVYRMLETWRTSGMDLTADAVQIPAANIVYDLMHAAGIPDGGIAMVLGSDMQTITDGDPIEPVICCVCGGPAHHLVEFTNGTALACDLHAKEAREAGLCVVTPALEPAQ